MKTKMIITAAFAALTLGTASLTMADENKDKNKDTSTPPTVCKCSAASKTELEKKAEEADKKAEEADKHAKDVENDDSASDEDKKKAREDKDKADKDKEKADKEAKDEEDKNAAKYGACVCPNGTTSYNIQVPAGSANASAPTSAFREVRGQ